MNVVRVSDTWEIYPELMTWCENNIGPLKTRGVAWPEASLPTASGDGWVLEYLGGLTWQAEIDDPRLATLFLLRWA